jgi:hypothetical protein
MAKDEKTIEWSAPEYEYHEKSSDWFWALGIITVGLFLSAILLKSFLFAFLILLSGFSLALYSARKPNNISFKINVQGIHIGETIYTYENLKSFWIDYEPPHKKELIVESKKTLMPHIAIMLGEADPLRVRDYLLKFLKEEKIEEPLTTSIARFLKF